MTSLFNLPIKPFTFNPEFNFAVGPYAPMDRRPPSHFRIQLSPGSQILSLIIRSNFKFILSTFSFELSVKIAIQYT